MSPTKNQLDMQISAKIAGTYRLSVLEVVHYTNGLVELIGDNGVDVTANHIQEMFGLFETLEPRQ